jgi:hypothetical protein
MQGVEMLFPCKMNKQQQNSERRADEKYLLWVSFFAVSTVATHTARLAGVGEPLTRIDRWFIGVGGLARQEQLRQRQNFSWDLDPLATNSCLPASDLALTAFDCFFPFHVLTHPSTASLLEYAIYHFVLYAPSLTIRLQSPLRRRSASHPDPT